MAIPSQTQLQEDLPEDVRGRVFGVLNMLVSVASFLPIIIVGPIADLVGTTVGHLRDGDRRLGRPAIVSVHDPRPGRARRAPRPAADPHQVDPIAAALGADLPTWHPSPTSRDPPTEPCRAPAPPLAPHPGAGRPADQP